MKESTRDEVMKVDFKTPVKLFSQGVTRIVDEVDEEADKKDSSTPGKPYAKGRMTSGNAVLVGKMQSRIIEEPDQHKIPPKAEAKPPVHDKQPTPKKPPADEPSVVLTGRIVPQTDPPKQTVTAVQKPTSQQNKKPYNRKRTTSPGEMPRMDKIIPAVSKLGNIIGVYLYNKEVYELLRDYIFYRKDKGGTKRKNMIPEDFYKETQSAVFWAISDFVGIHNDRKDPPQINEISPDTEYLSTLFFLDRLFNNRLVSMEEDPMKFMSNYRSHFDDHDGVQEDFIPVLKAKLKNKAIFTDRGIIEFCNIIKEEWVSKTPSIAQPVQNQKPVLPVKQKPQVIQPKQTPVVIIPPEETDNEPEFVIPSNTVFKGLNELKEYTDGVKAQQGQEAEGKVDTPSIPEVNPPITAIQRPDILDDNVGEEVEVEDIIDDDDIEEYDYNISIIHHLENGVDFVGIISPGKFGNVFIPFYNINMDEVSTDNPLPSVASSRNGIWDWLIHLQPITVAKITSTERLDDIMEGTNKMNHARVVVLSENNDTEEYVIGIYRIDEDLDDNSSQETYDFIAKVNYLVQDNVAGTNLSYLETSLSIPDEFRDEKYLETYLTENPDDEYTDDPDGEDGEYDDEDDDTLVNGITQRGMMDINKLMAANREYETGLPEDSDEPVIKPFQ